MWFKYNINGITIQLQITEYQKTDPQNWDDFWCHIVLYLESPPWLSFHMEDECLLSCEIDNLIHFSVIISFLKPPRLNALSQIFLLF